MSGNLWRLKVGLCNGCFDLYHEGHRYFLQEARKHCDYLIVAVNSDESVSTLKGDSRPVWNLERRVRVLVGNPSVSAVIPFNGDALSLIQLIKPDVIIRGADQLHEATHLGALYITVPRLPGLSTTELLKEMS